ncbi:MAG: hypothetical protein ABFD49_03680 [Armatimonadota bacterium]|nr:hypothetical protein [bacterium]
MTGLGTKGKLGIVFALREEECGLAHALAESRSEMRLRDGCTAWSVGRLEVIAAVGGVGRHNCARATEMLIDRGAQWVIAAGFAAALDPVARVGDVVAAERIVLGGDSHQPTYYSDGQLLSALPPSNINPAFPIRACDLITVDSVIKSAERKQAIFRATGAGALDMESHSAARVCGERGIPFAAIRSISDCAGDTIPESIRELMAVERGWRQSIYVASRPMIWRDVLDMRRRACLAANNLADVLGMMLLRLI